MLFHELANLCKVGVLHGLGRSNALVLVVDQHALKQVQSFGRHPVFILVVDEGSPWDGLRGFDQLGRFVRYCEFVPFDVVLESRRAQNLNNASELVKVIRALKHGVDLKKHGG